MTWGGRDAVSRMWSPALLLKLGMALTSVCIPVLQMQTEGYTSTLWPASLLNAFLLKLGVALTSVFPVLWIQTERRLHWHSLASQSVELASTRFRRDSQDT